MNTVYEMAEKNGVDNYAPPGGEITSTEQFVAGMSKHGSCRPLTFYTGCMVYETFVKAWSRLDNHSQPRYSGNDTF